MVGHEQELKQFREAVAVEKKRLEDELAEERRKTQEAVTRSSTPQASIRSKFCTISCLV
jgi:hypothetical protein